jgi:putative transposase
VEANPIRFGPLSAQPFDDRCLSWAHDADSATGGAVSIWTVDGQARLRRDAITITEDGWT